MVPGMESNKSASRVNHFVTKNCVWLAWLIRTVWNILEYLISFKSQWLSNYSCAVWRMSCKMGSVSSFWCHICACKFMHACMHLSRFLSFSAILNSSRRCRFSPKLCFVPQLNMMWKYLSVLKFVVNSAWEQAWAEIKCFWRGGPLFLSIAIWQYDKSEIIFIRVLEIY